MRSSVVVLRRGLIASVVCNNHGDDLTEVLLQHMEK